MEWKDYLQERINAAPSLIKEHLRNVKFERAIILRMTRFANSFLEGGGGEVRIMILYGLRGIGKSTILFQFYKRLRTGNFLNTPDSTKEVPQENILYMSIDQTLLTTQSKSESPIYDAVKNFCEAIHNQTLESLNKKLFILVDEAQFDKRWAIAAKSLFDASKNIFIVITGSSALALNIDTDTARRSIKEPLFPLSFMEYQMIKNWIFPPKGTAENMKNLVLNNDKSAIADLNLAIKKIKEDMNKKGLNIEKELNEYIAIGGFPYGMLTSKDISYRRIVDMINRIVAQDMPEISNFETNSIPDIMRIIGAIALKPSGELSQTKLSQNLGIPSAKVNTIIATLEKTHLILTVKPYLERAGGGGFSKGHKYYFMSPTLLSAIKHMNGVTTISPEHKGLFWENAVASTLFKLCYTTGTINTLFYDPRKETNADFLLQNPLSGRIIPIEVGLNKDNKQISNAIDYYKTGHGILVSDFEEIGIDGKVIKIPFWLFFYL